VPRIDQLIDEQSDLPSNGPRPRKPERHVLDQRLSTASTNEPKLYEVDVFNHLLAHKDALGIRNVFQLKNASADGELELRDGRRVLVEIKYRMNWDKACQAGWQLLESLRLLEPFRVSPVPYAGLVFFEKFTGDWDRKAASRPLEDGWYYWYAGHHEIREDFSAVLVHLEDGALETYSELCAAGG
jgi:hypothetical protein